MKEYQIVTKSDGDLQQVLNQWRLQYEITIVAVFPRGNALTAVIIREGKES